jgi:hypothetical protein
MKMQTQNPVDPVAAKFPQWKAVFDQLEFSVAPEETIPKSKGYFQILSTIGDGKYIWDKSKTPEVEAARTLFKNFTKSVKDGGAGYNAFYVAKDGKPSEPMKNFDSEAESAIFVPPLVGG